MASKQRDTMKLLLSDPGEIPSIQSSEKDDTLKAAVVQESSVSSQRGYLDSSRMEALLRADDPTTYAPKSALEKPRKTEKSKIEPGIVEKEPSEPKSIARGGYLVNRLL